VSAPASIAALNGRQVEVPEPLHGHVGRVVFTPALGLAVRREVLRARDDLVRRTVVGSLGGLHARGRQHRPEIRILARALGDPAPPWLVRDVDHRAVDLLDPGRRRLARGDPVVRLRDVGIEATRLAERDREDRPEAVDGVECEQERDVQPRLLHGHVLEVVDLLWVGQAEDRTDSLSRLSVGDLAVGQQLKLLQLLFESHLGEQGVHPAVDALAWGSALTDAASRRNRPTDNQRAQRQDRSCEREPSPRNALLPQAMYALACFHHGSPLRDGLLVTGTSSPGKCSPRRER